MTFNGTRIAVLGAAAVFCSGVAFGQTGNYSSQDKMFMKTAAEGSMTEIKLSQIALKKSNNEDVKAYAQKMIDDHNKLISDMKPFVDQAGVTPPAHLKPEHEMAAKKLESLSGDAFDKQYITDMVKDHHKTLAAFKAEDSSTQNQDFKAVVDQGQQVVQQHADMIDQMAQKDGIAVPASAM